MEALRKTLPLILLCSLILACTQSSVVFVWIDENELLLEEYMSFLKYKNKDDSSEQADQYIQSEALTYAIEKSPLYQSTQLEAELREKQKAWLLERYFDLFLSEHVNEEAIREFYHSDLNTLVEPKVAASHILVRTSNSMSLDQRRDAFEQADAIYNKLKSGADFAQMASQFSDDSLTASKGGSLGFLSKDDINQQFSDTAFNQLRTGEISKPFQSRFGFHILKITAEQQFEKIPLEKVKPQIIQMLSKNLREQEMNRLLNSVVITRPES